jgi:hypothetical protein
MMNQTKFLVHMVSRGSGWKVISRTLCDNACAYNRIMYDMLLKHDPFVISSNGEVRRSALPKEEDNSPRLDNRFP